MVATPITLDSRIYKLIKQASFRRHILYSIFFLPFSISVLIGGVGVAIFSIYATYTGEYSLALGIGMIVIGLSFAITLGFFWSRSMFQRFTNPVSGYLVSKPEMIVWVKIVGIKTSLSAIPFIGIKQQKLLLYTSDLKLGYISIPKNKMIEVYEELQRVLPHAKFGDTDKNAKWYNENYLFKDCNTWFQREFTRSLKEA